jgi:hypothetical protein
MRAIHDGSLDRSKREPENLSAGGALSKLPRKLTEPFDQVYVEERLGRVSGKMPVAKALRYLLNH